MNAQHERIGINGFLAIAALGVVIAALVFGALAVDALWTIVAVLAVIGVVIILSLAAISLIVRFAAPAVVGIGNIRLEAQRERNRHDEKLIEKGLVPDYIKCNPIAQLKAPEPEQETETAPLDPRHELLVNLCLLTIKDNRYGPTSCKLMTADEGTPLMEAARKAEEEKVQPSLVNLFKSGKKTVTPEELQAMPDVRSGAKTVEEMADYLEGKGIQVEPLRRIPRPAPDQSRRAELFRPEGKQHPLGGARPPRDRTSDPHPIFRTSSLRC